MRALVRAGVVLVCLLAGVLAVSDAPALAVLRYPVVAEVSPAGTPSGRFVEPYGIAFDGESNGFVVAGAEIDAFGPSNEFEWFAPQGADGVAVNESTGEIYADKIPGGFGTVTGIQVFGSAGEPLFEINSEGDGKPVPGGVHEPEAITVDQETGDVYVYDRWPGHEAIDVFTATGEYLFQITGAGSNGLGHFVRGMVVDDATGELLVGDELENGENGRIYVFDAATGAYLTAWTGADTPQKSLSGQLELAVDNANGEVYVAAGGLNESGRQQVPAVVDRLTATGEYKSEITGLPGEQFPADSVYGVTVSPTSGEVYVLQECTSEIFCPKVNHGVVDVFAASPVAMPHVVLQPSSELKATSVTLHGMVNPEETGEATCEFEYGTSPEYGEQAPCAAPVANGNAPVAVEAKLEGLHPDTTYYYRLDGKNVADGYTNIGEGSEDLGQLTTTGPALVSEAVSAVTAESVSFDGVVEPNGNATSAYFQYGTSENYGDSAPAAPGVALGAGKGEASFTRQVQGLSPGTVYHYRMVVLSEVEAGVIREFDGADHTFTTQPSTTSNAVADDRTWELVTPAQKHGALFFAQNYAMLGGDASRPFVAQASVNGDAMINLASAPTEDEPKGNGPEVSVLSTRGSTGWSSQVIAPEHESATGPSQGGEYHFFSEDLSRGLVLPFGAHFSPLSPQANEPTPYLRDDYLNGNVDEHCETSCYLPLVTSANTRPGAVFGEEVKGECQIQVCGPELVDATPDAEHVVLSAFAQLTPTPSEGQHGQPLYYEWGEGRLQPLYLLPQSEGGQGVQAGRLGSIGHQLSDNGSVFFAYKEHLYLHDFSKETSVRLDFARGVVEPPAGGASFLYASSDGSRVLFSDPKRLTSATGGGIYECQIAESGGVPNCGLRLTGLPSGSLIDGSEDASYLYFESPQGKLIVDHYAEGKWATTTGPTIGELVDSNVPIFRSGSLSMVNGAQAPVTAVSPDGRYLTFMSDESLGRYDTQDAISGRRDVEVYLYDAVTNKLVCASCNPTGARPVGVEYNEEDLTAGSLGGKTPNGWEASNLPPWTRPDESQPSSYQPRFLFDSGRLFFDSNDALVPTDVNGTQDVYEYEPPDIGGCTTSSATYSERTDGCVSLISAGSSIEESAFMDAGANGRDAFFITLSKLVPEDFDTALDVYDAHECTQASPCIAPPSASTPPCSTGDACKPAPTPQPSIFGAAASSTFSGAGNVRLAKPAPLATKKSLTRAQKLARALKACSKGSQGRRRERCERSARKRYGPVAAKSGKAGKRGKRGRR